MDKNESELYTSIVDDIKNVLDQCNPYAQCYRMIRDRIKTNDICNLKLRIIGKRGHDARRYNMPTASEVAAIIVGDFESADADRDIIVETQTGYFKRVSVLSSAYLPLQYPLLFPRGDDGYRDDIFFEDSTRKESQKRKTVSMREFFAYKVQQRNN